MGSFSSNKRSPPGSASQRQWQMWPLNLWLRVAPECLKQPTGFLSSWPVCKGIWSGPGLSQGLATAVSISLAFPYMPSLNPASIQH